MVRIAAFYKFTPVDAPETLLPPLRQLGTAEGVTGTVLVAPEGVNGTIAGPDAGITAMLDRIREIPGCADLEWKESRADAMPFGRLKIRLKREIVTMGQPDVDPTRAVGRYVAPADWNALISEPDVVVIDTRNDYEVAIGSFQGAIDPKTESFGAFPDWFAANRSQLEGKRVAMFCTGGIRCEKSTNYLLGQGIEEVFHLQGGILKYLEEIPAAESLWEGECFVFDQRVSVGHGLRPGDFTMCFGCRRPLAPSELTHADYEPGVACHRCAPSLDPETRERRRERQRQIEHARARGERHLGRAGGRTRPD